MRITVVSFIFLLFVSISAYSQEKNGVGIGTTEVNSDAIFQIESDNKGVLIPRLSTSQRIGIATSSNGLMVYDTDIRALFFFNGISWEAVGSPAGTIVMWSGTTAPSGWAICNGTNGTPDLRGRFVVGMDEDAVTTPVNTTTQTLNYGAIGNMGGKNNHSLLESEIPEHTHAINNAPNHNHKFITSTAAEHDHGTDRYLYQAASSGGYQAGVTPNKGTSTHQSKQIPTSGGHNHSGTTDSNGSHSHTMGAVGSGIAHENRPPYYVLAYIIKL